MDAPDILDLMMRSAAAGVCLILAVVLSQPARTVQSARFGVLFALGAAAYAVATAPIVMAHMPQIANILKPYAILTPVFFWWFGLSIFCDDWRWSLNKLLPLASVSACIILERVGGSPMVVMTAHIIGELVHIGLIVHVLVVIARGTHDDLVETRRRGRNAWLTATGMVVIAAALVSLLRLKTTMPDIVLTLEAGGLLLASCGISAWALGVRTELFPGITPPRPPEPVRAARAASEDRLITQLRALMKAGAYTTPGLTVGGLAQKLSVREHRLRAVINRQLGYRNFAAFLNEYRIEAAKRTLADPLHSDRQILQIALDLGYGSIAPFNRAFRTTTGQAPTDFRRAALSPPSGFCPAAAE